MKPLHDVEKAKKEQRLNVSRKTGPKHRNGNYAVDIVR